MQELHLTKQLFSVKATYVVAFGIAKAKMSYIIADTAVKGDIMPPGLC